MSSAEVYHAPGKVIDVSEAEGMRLIDAGYAEKSNEKETGKVHLNIISENDIAKKKRAT